MIFFLGDSKMIKSFISVIVITAFCLSYSSADTFSHRKDGHVYHGYATSRTFGSTTEVHTKEHGILKLNIAEYDIKYDYTG